MSKARAKRPSPALVISLLALFVALGGSAYAAKKIGTKEIKNNAITPAKIMKGAVTTPKIKDNAITGAKIAEASLGSVPNAQHATTAASAESAKSATTAETAKSATTAQTAENALNFSHYFSSGLVKASHGQTVPLLEIGPFSIVGKCEDGGSGYSEARIYMTTSQVGSSMYSYEDSYYEADFNPGTEVELGYEGNNNGPDISWDDQYPYYTGFYAASADGETLLQGDAVNGVYVFGSQCSFWVDGTNAA